MFRGDFSFFAEKFRTLDKSFLIYFLLNNTFLFEVSYFYVHFTGATNEVQAWPITNKSLTNY